MRRRIIMVLLGLGAIGGYASGFHHVRACHGARQAAYERHIAETCVNAARGAPLPSE